MRIHYNLILNEIKYLSKHIKEVAVNDRATLLHLAITWELVDEVKLFLEQDVDINQKVRDWPSAKKYAFDKTRIFSNKKNKEILSLIMLQEEKLNLEKILSPAIEPKKIKI